MKKILSAILCVLALTGCSGTSPSLPTSTPDITPTPTPTPLPSETMTLEEKVGQMLMVRCDCITLSNIASIQPGAIVMFASDFNGLGKDEVISKINAMKEVLDITPYIAVDEEGGTVVRVSSNPKLAPSKYQSPQYYFKKGGMDLVNENTAEKSDLLLSLGINMNLAPVADVSQNSSDFIYSRSFGQDAEHTAEYISSTVGVMNQHNIASCLKHFPGYGENIDTHTSVAFDNRPLEQLRNCDFLPFISGIEAGVDAVLVSHNIVNNIDSSAPASISTAVHQILRDELAFKNLIITDDMSMEGVKSYSEPYKRAVLAGNDMIIVTDYAAAYDEILSAAKSEEIPEYIIDEAVNRIINQKAKRGLI